MLQNQTANVLLMAEFASNLDRIFLSKNYSMVLEHPIYLA